MDRKKLITVVGARPQFIKAAALSKAIARSNKFDEIIVHSGQHYDYNLSESFFKELNIPVPKYNLEIGSAPHNIQIANFLIGFEGILESEKPDMVIVFGDTNTTAAAAIASAKKNIPLAHVEAGLREFDKSIPEEVNKLITDSISDLLFSPTATGKENLSNQGIVKNVFVTGDISLDLLIDKDARYESVSEILHALKINGHYIFMTCHRDVITESKENLRQVFEAIVELHHPVIIPLHPRTRKALKGFDLEYLIHHENIHLLDPIGFWRTQSLIRSADFVITDSGGIIKEAYFHKTPAIIIDKQTEWVETVNEKWNVITGPDKVKIIEASKNIQKPEVHTQALGDGHCAERILVAIENYFL